MTEKDLQIQDLKAENEKLKEELEQLKQPKAAVNTDMDKLTTEMMEHICDNLCKHPCYAKDQEELDEICAECKMGKFMCDILNTYNRQMQQLKEYQVLGTVEELKEAREKQIPKKPKRLMGINGEVTICPNCNGTIRGYQQHYCDGCGQSLVVDDGGTSKAGGIE